MDIDKISYKDILYNLHDGLYLVDCDRIITYWNKSAEKISGFTQEEVIGKSCSDNILTHVDSEGNNLCLGRCPIAGSISYGKPCEAEIYMHHKNGHRLPVSVRTNVLTDSDGKIIGGVELFTDISNRRTGELRIKELEKLALLDSLTQLANRNYIEKELRMRFEENKRLNIPFGILYMDIDYFKKFNDTYGHNVGDNVLKFIANTFINNSRPFDIYGRWGGDEFIGIIRYMTCQDLEQLGNRLRVLIENSYLSNGNEKLHITICIGATLVNNNDTIESLLKRADTLLYKSKSTGRNCLTIG